LPTCKCSGFATVKPRLQAIVSDWAGATMDDDRRAKVFCHRGKSSGEFIAVRNEKNSLTAQSLDQYRTASFFLGALYTAVSAPGLSLRKSSISMTALEMLRLRRENCFLIVVRRAGTFWRITPQSHLVEPS
jgi:hypothetical protein